MLLNAEGYGRGKKPNQLDAFSMLQGWTMSGNYLFWIPFFKLCNDPQDRSTALLV